MWSKEVLPENAALILSYCHSRNRQGYDLHDMFSAWNWPSRLLQYGNETKREESVYAVPEPQSACLHRVHLASKIVRARFLREGLLYPHRLTVALNMPAVIPQFF